MKKTLYALLLLLVLTAASCGKDDEVDKTIRFNTMGGETIDPIVYNLDNINDSHDLPTPIRDGFVFVGWYHDQAMTDPFEVLNLVDIFIEGDETTLYAKWEPEAVIETSTITFNANGGTNVAAITADVGSAITAPANPTKLGYTFAGWYADAGLSTVFVFSVMPETDTTVYAKWEPLTFQIIFRDDDSVISSHDFDYNASTAGLSYPAYEPPTGFEVSGWSSDIPATMPASDVTITVVLEEIDYTLTFEDDQGLVLQETIYHYGDGLTNHVFPKAPEKEGYQFTEWSNDLPETMPASDLVIIAIYDQVVWIYFDANGGTYEITRMSGTPGTLIYFEDDPVREGYQFIGWFEDIEQTIPLSYEVLQEMDTTIYAGWEEIIPDDVTLTFEENGGTHVPDLIALPGTPISEL